MINDRRWWVLGPLLLLVVLLLSRGPVQESDGRASAGTRSEEVAAEPHARNAGAEPSEVTAVESPRHPDVGFRTRDRLVEHFRKHGREFRVRTAEDYLRLAQILRDRPRDENVLEFVRNDAVTCKFDRGSGAFVAYNSDGTLRTFFKPNEGEAYFERQKSQAFDAR